MLGEVQGCVLPGPGLLLELGPFLGPLLEPESFLGFLPEPGFLPGEYWARELPEAEPCRDDVFD